MARRTTFGFVDGAPRRRPTLDKGSGAIARPEVLSRLVPRVWTGAGARTIAAGVRDRTADDPAVSSVHADILRASYRGGANQEDQRQQDRLNGTHDKNPRPETASFRGNINHLSL